MLNCDHRLDDNKTLVCTRCDKTQNAKWHIPGESEVYFEPGDRRELLPHNVNCDVQGLGSWLAMYLESWGITKERYIAWMKRFGLMKESEGKCNCVKREYLLDRLTPVWIARRLFRKR